MLVSSLVELIGEIPVSYGDLTYCIYLIVLLWIVDCFFGVIRLLIRS